MIARHKQLYDSQNRENNKYDMNAVASHVPNGPGPGRIMNSVITFTHTLQNEMLVQCWLHVDPASQTLGQH